MIKGNRLKFVYLLPLLFMFNTAAAKANMTKDMVRFDQAYIPVLALTLEEKLKASQVAMKLLMPAWQSFREQYRLAKPNDARWQTDIDRIDAYIRASGNIIARGTGLKDAHEELEQVRIVFMGMRERNGIEYFVDHLTRFHEPMEEIVLAVKGKTADTLEPGNIDFVRKRLPKVKQLWQATSNAKLDSTLYEFDAAKAAMLHGLIRKEQQALMRLEKAIEAGERKEIIAAGLGIKPNFAELFKSFGRFPSAG